MSSITKLKRDLLTAEVTSLEGMIGRLTDIDLLTRMSLESRLGEVQSEIAELGELPEQGQASIALFFGGEPVVNQHGIQASFASSAIGHFQDLVSKCLAQTEGPLGQRGVVPNLASSRLHVTNIVRGSFGFLLEELDAQRQFVDTSLKEAVDNVSELIRIFSGENENAFDEFVTGVDQRVLDSARKFFETLSRERATLRAVSSEKEVSVNSTAVNRAVERATSIEFVEELKTVSGRLLGVLPQAHRYELEIAEPDNGVITGPVDRNIGPEILINWGHNFIGRDVEASVEVRKVIRHRIEFREIVTLTNLRAQPDE